MFNVRAVLLLLVAIFAGCTTASGPTYTKYSVALTNGESAYRVTCYGLLEGASACRKEAEAVCQGQPVRLLQGDALLGAISGGKPDDRVILFECGAPGAQPTSALPPKSSTPGPPALTMLTGDANFDTAQATLTTAARSRLDDLIKEAKGASVNSATVNGYTDSVGSGTYNQNLSERRATAVAKYLHDHGLVASKFVQVGYGDTDAIDTNATPEGRARNRRVEILLDLDKN